MPTIQSNQLYLPLPKNHIAQLVHKVRKNMWTKKLQAASDLTCRLHTRINSFIEKHMDSYLRDLYIREGIQQSRIAKIKSVLFFPELKGEASDPEGIFSKDSLPEDVKEEYEQLKKEADDLVDVWYEAYASALPKYASIYKFLLKNKDEYARFVDQHRLHPDLVTIPHPENIRVLAAVSQTSGSFMPDIRRGERLSLHTQWVTRAFKAKKNLCIDDAIADVTSTAYVQEGSVERGFQREPDIQKPVSTIRGNRNTWRKIDNTNNKIKRIVIFIITDDMSGLQQAQAGEIKKCYREESVDGYIADTDPAKEDAYRVDKIIVVRAPTSEDAANGITHKVKIERAFKEAQEFVDEQKELVKAAEPGSEQSLKFEGIAHWLGHGTTIESIKKDEDKSSSAEQLKENDSMYLEGSMEFCFITKHHPSLEGVDETTIKEWESNYLRSFEDFIHDVHSCAAGAFIA